MVTPEPVPTPVSAPPGSAERLGKCLLAVALAGGVITVGAVCAIRRNDREKRLWAELRSEDGGRVAWVHDKGEIRWIDLDSVDNVHKVRTDSGAIRVAWSTDGERLFAVLESGAFDKTHRIVSFDRATGDSKTILDLGTQGLEDNDLDEKEVWVAPFGEAESSGDRVYFRLPKGEWYSVESKRPRVRPEPGAPARKWDQVECPDGKHRVKKESDDDDSWLAITDGKTSVKFTSDGPSAPAAWWCRPR